MPKDSLIMTDSDFEKDEIIASLDEGGSIPQRKTTRIKMKYEDGPSNGDSEYWYKIKIREIDQEFYQRLNRICVLAGELFKHADRNLPQYRIYRDAKESGEFLLSREVAYSQRFFEFYAANIFPTLKLINRKWTYPNAPVMEGAGRGFFLKYFYLDNDFHADNALKNRKNYFTPIDHDWCLVPVTMRMHQDQGYSDMKKDEKSPDGWTAYPVVRTFNTVLTVWDYDNLPIVKDYQPGCFPWNKTKDAIFPYAEILAKHPLFLNEKHFMALKTLVTKDFEIFLKDAVIQDYEDHGDLIKLTVPRFAELAKVLSQSVAFMKYVKTNRMAAMQAIMFELYDTLNHARHNLPAKIPNESEDQWQARMVPVLIGNFNQAIECYSELLSELGEHHLTWDEKNKLRIFAEGLCAQDAKVLTPVEDFYTAQGMLTFADLASEYSQSMKRLKLDSHNRTTEAGVKEMQLPGKLVGVVSVKSPIEQAIDQPPSPLRSPSMLFNSKLSSKAISSLSEDNKASQDKGIRYG